MTKYEVCKFNDELILKVEELLFENNEKITLQAYNMPNTLLWIDYTLITTYLNSNALLAEFLNKKQSEHEHKSKKEETKKVEKLLRQMTKPGEEWEDEKEEVDEEYFNNSDRPRAASEKLGAEPLDQTFGSVDQQRKATISQKISYTPEEWVKKVEYFIPIEQRIFQNKHSAIDITLANTIWTALRNYASDGEQKLKSIHKSNSFSFEELIQFESDIESRRNSTKKMNNPLCHPLPLYSLKTLDTLDLAQQEAD